MNHSKSLTGRPIETNPSKGDLDGSPAPVLAQPSIEALLQRPLSVGVVGLLGAEPKGGGVEAALQNALNNEQPHVRAAAARMLSSQPGNTAGVLESVLEHENDFEAALEESYALLAATNGAKFPSVVAAGPRRVIMTVTVNFALR